MTTNRGFESENRDKHNESDNKSIAEEDLSTYFSDHKIVIPEIDKVFMNVPCNLCYQFTCSDYDTKIIILT